MAKVIKQTYFGDNGIKSTTINVDLKLNKDKVSYPETTTFDNLLEQKDQIIDWCLQNPSKDKIYYILGKGYTPTMSGNLTSVDQVRDKPKVIRDDITTYCIGGSTAIVYFV